MIDKTKIELYRRDPIRFLEDHYFIGRGKRIQFEDWQRDDILLPLLYTKNVDGRPVRHVDPCPCGSGRVFGACCIGEYPRRYNESLIGLPKKNGKSELAAAVAFYELFFGDCPEIYFVSNSKEQTRSLTFDRLRRAIQWNRQLKNGLKIYTNAIENPASNGTVSVLPHNAASVAGRNPSMVVFDEMWAFTSVESERLFSEMTTSPARTECLNLTVSYAGYTRSGCLWRQYERGRDGGDPKYFYYWSHENKASWVSKAYLDQQRARLPAPIFKRLHENRWSAGGGFISDALIDKAVNPALRYGVDHGGSVGVDLGLRHDLSCVARVKSDFDGRLRLCDLKTWRGSKADEVVIESVEDEIIRQFEIGGAHQCLIDVWQMAGSKQRLERRIKIQEFSFTSQGTARLAQVLYDAFTSQRIEIPSDPELITELRNLELVESGGGWRFDSKRTSAGHHDRVTALALGILGEIERPAPGDFDAALASLDSAGSHDKHGDPSCDFDIVFGDCDSEDLSYEMDNW